MATTANPTTQTSHNVAETRDLGARLGRLLHPGDIILLQGPLGAGKTHLAQGIGAGLGIPDPIRSPTFTLINEYHNGRLPLYHIDLYRLSGNADIATIGLDELLAYDDGVIVIEWPEQASDWMPTNVMHIALIPLDDQHRTIRLTAVGERYLTLLNQLHTQESKETKDVPGT